MNENLRTPTAWCFFEPDSVPEQWENRARQVFFVPLLPDEVHLLRQEVTAANDHDEPFLRLVAVGTSRRDIARQLNLPLRTVDRRLSALTARFGLETTSELVAFLARRGF